MLILVLLFAQTTQDYAITIVGSLPSWKGPSCNWRSISENTEVEDGEVMPLPGAVVIIQGEDKTGESFISDLKGMVHFKANPSEKILAKIHMGGFDPFIIQFKAQNTPIQLQLESQTPGLVLSCPSMGSLLSQKPEDYCEPESILLANRGQWSDIDLWSDALYQQDSKGRTLLMIACRDGGPVQKLLEADGALGLAHLVLSPGKAYASYNLDMGLFYEK